MYSVVLWDKTELFEKTTTWFEILNRIFDTAAFFWFAALQVGQQLWKFANRLNQVYWTTIYQKKEEGKPNCRACQSKTWPQVQMFEKIVSETLSKYLGDYIQGKKWRNNNHLLLKSQLTFSQHAKQLSMIRTQQRATQNCNMER